MSPNSTEVTPTKRDIPGMEVIGRGILLKPQQPYQLKARLWPTSETPNTFVCHDTHKSYLVPSDCAVNPAPPTPGGAALGQVQITESFENLEQSFQVDAKVAAGGGPFTVNVNASQVSQLRSKVQSVYAVSQSFLPFWEIYMPDMHHNLPQLDTSGVPTPFDPIHKKAYQRFFNLYGSHVVKRVWVGGKAVLSVITQKTEQMSSEDMRMAISMKVGTSEGEVNARQSSARDSLKNSSDIVVFGEGGDKLKLGALRSLDEKAFSAWVDSIRDNPKVIEMELEGIWNLIDDQAVADALAEAYETETYFEPIGSLVYRDPDLYIVRASNYVCMDLETRQVRKTGHFKELLPDLPSSFLHFDASFSGDTPPGIKGPKHGKIFFFKGRYFLQMDRESGAFDEGFPKPIQGEENGKPLWPGLALEAVDAAVNWGDGTAYLFSGTQYVRYDLVNDRVEPGYPRPIQPFWEGIPFERIDACTTWDGRKAYFVRGNAYIRYDMQEYRADPGYPKWLTGGYVEDWDFE